MLTVKGVFIALLLDTLSFTMETSENKDEVAILTNTTTDVIIYKQQGRQFKNVSLVQATTYGDPGRHDQDVLPCDLKVTKKSANVFENTIDVYDPNLVRFRINYRNITVEHEPGVIEPHHWIWTYYSPQGFFPYLKLPVDFSILSFRLLDSKTLPLEHMYIDVESEQPNCTLKIGQRSTTVAIGNALKNMTMQYLLHLNQFYTFTYYCFLAEVPGVKNTLAYQIGVYFNFPVEFARYNCCRTHTNHFNSSDLNITCLDRQISKMYQVTIIPYIMGLVVFAYFPLFLVSAAASINETSGGSGFIQTNKNGKWVFLDGSAPVCFTKFIGGFCGLVDRFPIAVSRIRRTFFVLVSPIVIFIEIYIYNKYLKRTTLALLRHGCPMGYLSMIGGFDLSKKSFLPFFGGPYIVLCTFFVGGIIFVILPSKLCVLILNGCTESFAYKHVCPLFLDLKSIEMFSAIKISDKTGYRRPASIMKAKIFMLTNYKFWLYTLRLQYKRIQKCFSICKFSGMRTAIVLTLFIIIFPMYLLFCFVELLFCIFFYGIPLLNGIVILVKGYFCAQSKFFEHRHANRKLSVLLLLIKIVYFSFTTFLFIYFVFGISTIFIASFAFIAEVVALCFMSVIIYPSFSFGYLFFGLALLYYVVKLFKNFGSAYSTLLSDAIDASADLENIIPKIHTVNGTIYINDTLGMEISKLQVQDHVIPLSVDQIARIRNIQNEEHSKIIYRKHAPGIPKDLFDHLVHVYLPVNIQIARAILKLIFILALIVVSLSVILVRRLGEGEGVSEVMHVIFIIAIGALPRIVEVAMDNKNYAVKKEIRLRKIKATIEEYWSNQSL